MAVAQAGETLYVGGSNASRNACYWIVRGREISSHLNLSANDGAVTSIVHDGEFLHIVMYEKDGLSKNAQGRLGLDQGLISSYWKIQGDNRIVSQFRLSLPTSKSSGAYGIVVVND